ncbi:MAG: carboxypeptidase regulatory-like domain-containing protein, partial [Armatimonadetes bacterium]|nr:carboxypeptidase regulatory-like domain-containing protein [Armatimonadota bacterium]
KWRLVAPEDTYLTDTRVGGARPSLLKAGDVLDLGELRVTLRKRVRLLGRVVWADGTPAPGARVDWGYDLRGPLVLGAGPRVAGLDGRFTIEQFFDSSRWSKIQLQASHQGYCSPDGQDVRLAGRSGTEEVTLILGQRRLATVHGRLLDPHGRPVPNAGVAVGGYDGARWSPSIKTDREGRFTAECWPDRTYRFYGLAEGFGGARTKPVHLRGGVSRLPPLVLPPLSESLRLKVVAPNSRPAGEAVVDFVRGGRSQHEEPWQVGLAYLSDAEGRLELEGLAAGKYPIEIRYQGLVFRATAQTGAGTQTVRLRRAIRRLPADRGPRIEDVYVE